MANRNSNEMKNKEVPKQNPISSIKQVCIEHNKKLEAFCEKDL